MVGAERRAQKECRAWVEQAARWAEGVAKGLDAYGLHLASAHSIRQALAHLQGIHDLVKLVLDAMERFQLAREAG